MHRQSRLRGPLRLQTMHGSGDNITPSPRSNVFIVYNSIDNTLTKPFATPGRRPAFLAAHDFTPLPYP